MVTINFKYEVNKKVFYNNKSYIILSRSYMETSKGNKLIKYNLKSNEEFIPNVLEDELSNLKLL